MSLLCSAPSRGILQIFVLTNPTPSRGTSIKKTSMRLLLAFFSLRARAKAVWVLAVPLIVAPLFYILPELRDLITLRTRLYMFLSYLTLVYALWRVAALRDQVFGWLSETFLEEVKLRNDLELLIILLDDDQEMKAWISSRYPDYNDDAFIAYICRNLRGR